MTNPVIKSALQAVQELEQKVEKLRRELRSQRHLFAAAIASASNRELVVRYDLLTKVTSDTPQTIRAERDPVMGLCYVYGLVTTDRPLGTNTTMRGNEQTEPDEDK